VLSRFQDRIDPSDNPLVSQLLAEYASRMRDGARLVADVVRPVEDQPSSGQASGGSRSPPDLDRLLAIPLEESAYATSVRVSPRTVFAEPGERVVFEAEITNRGAVPLWIAAHSDGAHGVGLTFHLLRGTGEVLEFDTPRRYCADPVPAGETTIMDFVYRVPNEYGHLVLEFDLVHDGFRWFHPQVDDAARVEIFAGVPRGAK
jgi:catechol 2,3-dioxygenase-like lactoylglutathione lyase family enzyme